MTPETAAAIRRNVQRFTSRKFLFAVSAFVGVTMATFAPTYKDEVVDAIVKIGGAFAAMLVAVGYIVAEAKIDASDQQRPEDTQ